jgi:hypothetical protein
MERKYPPSQHALLAVREINAAIAELRQAMNRQDHPNRIADYVREVERQCRFMHDHLRFDASMPRNRQEA